MGMIHSETKMAALYNTAEVFICPSRKETLPTTIAEALSCGVPCCGFSIGGIPDLIEHQQNGWLAEPYDAESLAEGIRWILDPRAEDGGRRMEIRDQQLRNDQLSANARIRAESMGSFRSVAQRHLSVYGNLAAD
jgi:glycosyltransferase involved in cell wall biosynthesis